MSILSGNSQLLPSFKMRIARPVIQSNISIRTEISYSGYLQAEMEYVSGQRFDENFCGIGVSRTVPWRTRNPSIQREGSEIHGPHTKTHSV